MKFHEEFFFDLFDFISFFSWTFLNFLIHYALSWVNSQTGDSGQKNKNMNVKTGQIAQTPRAYLHENAAPIKMINN